MNVSVIVPAYNEEHVLGRLLDALDDRQVAHQIEVIVVCNGCTDNTELVAKGHPLAPRVQVLAQGSKNAALRAGDEVARYFPRFYVDADVQVTAQHLLRMAEVLTNDALLAVGPSRDLQLQRSSWGVRKYYQAWEALPDVQQGLYGRGVIGVSEDGYARICARPDVSGDDLFVHSRFAPSERTIVPTARAVIHAPITVRDLVRRRVRTTRGNAELRAVDPGGIKATGSTVRDLTALARRRPGLVPGAAVFAGVAAMARFRARGTMDDHTVWLRDESRAPRQPEA